MNPMIRATGSMSVAVKLVGDIATATIIDTSLRAGGAIHIATGAGIGTITFYGCDTSDGTYKPLYDDDGTAVSKTSTGPRIIPLPDACFGVPYLKLIGDAAGTVVLTQKS